MLCEYFVDLKVFSCCFFSKKINETCTCNNTLLKKYYYLILLKNIQ